MAMFHFFPRQARALPPTTRPSRRQGAQRRAWAPPSAPPALVLTRTCPGAPRRSLLGEAESLAGRAVAAMVGGVVTALVGCPFDVPEAAPRTPRTARATASAPLAAPVRAAHVPPLVAGAQDAADESGRAPAAVHWPRRRLRADRARRGPARPVQGLAARLPSAGALAAAAFSSGSSRSARHLVPHLHSSRVVQAPFNILNYLIMEQLTATFLGRTM